MKYDFTATPMREIIEILQNDNSDTLEFKAMNPDHYTGRYAGEKKIISNKEYLYRSIRSWCDLSELLGYRMLTPQALSEHEVLIRYQKLKRNISFHEKPITDPTEKYGISSEFAKINKSEEPAFLWHYTNALKAARIIDRSTVLNLGINRGDEFAVIKDMLPKQIWNDIEFIGIDHSASVIKYAKSRMDHENMEFICADINDLSGILNRKCDLVISIGTLQSPGINTKTLIMSLVQKHMIKNGAMILGFPNARWIDGELIYGAKAPNYPYPEMSLVIKDIYWIKKYLQQHRFRVTVTGREYLFLTATKTQISK